MNISEYVASLGEQSGALASDDEVAEIVREAGRLALEYAMEHTPADKDAAFDAEFQQGRRFGKFPEAESRPSSASGSMKAAWAIDSQLEPVEMEGGIGITLVNAVPYPPGHSARSLDASESYASFVNDGHMMDRHYVPRLGVTVGTQTVYVPGLHIIEGAALVFEAYIHEHLPGAIVRTERIS